MGENEINPAISIIVPVYNVVTYLQRCVNSILEQIFTDYELILIDDGSTDGSGELCDQLATRDERIKVYHQSNKGLSGARNTGIKLARGKYIGFVDSDDWIVPSYYLNLYNAVVSTKCEVATCLFRKVQNDYGEMGKIKTSVLSMSREESMKKYLNCAISGKNDVCSACTKLYNRNLFEDLLFPEGMMFEDVVTNWAILCRSKGMAFCDMEGYFYYNRENSITTKAYTSKVIDLVKGAEMMIENAVYIDEDIYELLMKYRYKTEFSVLIKMLRNRYNSRDEYMPFMVSVKKNYLKLLLSSLPFSRKIVLLILKIVPNRIMVLWMGKKKDEQTCFKSK